MKGLHFNKHGWIELTTKANRTYMPVSRVASVKLGSWWLTRTTMEKIKYIRPERLIPIMRVLKNAFIAAWDTIHTHKQLLSCLRQRLLQKKTLNSLRYRYNSQCASWSLKEWKCGLLLKVPTPALLTCEFRCGYSNSTGPMCQGIMITFNKASCCVPIETLPHHGAN